VAVRGLLPPGAKVRGAAPPTGNAHPQCTEQSSYTLTHCNANAKIPNFPPSNAAPVKCRPRRPSHFPPTADIRHRLWTCRINQCLGGPSKCSRLWAASVRSSPTPHVSATEPGKFIERRPSKWLARCLYAVWLQLRFDFDSTAIRLLTGGH